MFPFGDVEDIAALCLRDQGHIDQAFALLMFPDLQQNLEDSNRDRFRPFLDETMRPRPDPPVPLYLFSSWLWLFVFPFNRYRHLISSRRSRSSNSNTLFSCGHFVHISE